MKLVSPRPSYNNLSFFRINTFEVPVLTRKQTLIQTFCLVPSVAPTQLAAGAINSTSIWVKWSHLSTSSSNGILRGYIVKYRRKKYSENISVSPTSGEVILGNLWKFTSYHIQVAGFTSNGHGPFSETFRIPTDEDGKETCRSRVVQGRIQLPGPWFPREIVLYLVFETIFHAF
jgi:hypothetical protein